MAIYHLRMQPICRRQGRSSIAAAAYRSGVRLTDRQSGTVHDFRQRKDIIHRDIILPRGVGADWARDRERLWNTAEISERRLDARVAREFEVAIPTELPLERRLAAVLEFAGRLADRYGVVVDVALHRARENGDPRNVHAHLLMSTRVATETGLGEKSDFERPTAWLASQGLPSTREQLETVRSWWEQIANFHLESGGQTMRIDRRSHRDRKQVVASSRHVGAAATAMERRGSPHGRRRVNSETARRNAEIIVEKPNAILDLIGIERRRCGRLVITQILMRYVGDDHRLLRRAHKAVMNAHVESEAGRIATILSGLADQHLQLLAVGDEEGRKALRRREIKFVEAVRSSMRREPALEAALRKRRVSPIGSLNPDALDGSYRL